MIKVIDNFLPMQIFPSIRNNFLTNVKWEYFNGTATTTEEPKDFYFLYNLMMYEPDLIRLLNQRINELNLLDHNLNIVRCKANLTVRNENGYHTAAHIDRRSHHYVLVMYVIDSDGDTIIYDEKWDGIRNPILSEDERSKLKIAQCISPKQNRCVLFDGHYYHSYHFPRNHNRRIVININLK